jgi:hypothetical protein
VIEKGDSEKLGMHIKGGLQGQRGNPLDKSDEGVFVSKINSVGAARRDGRLRAGMRLLEVNGKSLLGATHQEAVNTLRACGNEIHLVVCKGYDRADVDKAIAEGRLTRAGSVSSRSQSVSSLDIPDEDVQQVSDDAPKESRVDRCRGPQEQNMKSELVQFEKEDAEKRLKLPEHDEEDDLHLVEAKASHARRQGIGRCQGRGDAGELSCREFGTSQVSRWAKFGTENYHDRHEQTHAGATGDNSK